MNILSSWILLRSKDINRYEFTIVICKYRYEFANNDRPLIKFKVDFWISTKKLTTSTNKLDCWENLYKIDQKIIKAQTTNFYIGIYCINLDITSVSQRSYVDLKDNWSLSSESLSLCINK